MDIQALCADRSDDGKKKRSVLEYAFQGTLLLLIANRFLERSGREYPIRLTSPSDAERARRVTELFGSPHP
jgi:hypothetical protein